MRALIVATGESRCAGNCSPAEPRELTPVVDRPFVQAVVETLASQGIDRLDLVLAEEPERFERLLGDGCRWGVSITYHLVKDAQRPYRPLATLGHHDPVWIAHADRLPGPDALAAVSDQSGPGPVLVTAGDEDTKEWSGWALLPAGVESRPPFDSTFATLGLWLRSRPGATSFHSGVCLSVRSGAEEVETNRAVLKGDFPLAVGGRESREGIWIARTARVHPTAKLVPPVYLGESSQVAEAAVVGPFAVIGEESIVGVESSVSQAVLRAGSYLGPEMRLSNAIVDGGRLQSLTHGVAMRITDEQFLGAVPAHTAAERPAKPLERVLAALMFLALLPIAALTGVVLKLCRVGPVLCRSHPVRIPRETDGRALDTFALWSFTPCGTGRVQGPGKGRASHLLLRILPGLLSVVRGDLRFVGVPPRTPEEVEALPEYWRDVYLKAEPGLLTETDVRTEVSEHAEMMLASEAFHATRPGWQHAVALWREYLFGRRNRSQLSHTSTTLTLRGAGR